MITYLHYLLEYSKRPTYNAFKGYIKYSLTNQGEDLYKKIRELEDKGVNNNLLKTKIENLFVHKEEEPKLHFVFSRNGGEEKEELRELLDVMGREDTGKLYRGQADATWKLNASLTRELKYVKNESEMYYDILSLKPDAFVNDNSVYERLITMQHFGMPTRLMDITRNPLVAIFFACNNMSRHKSDGVVFTFAPQKKDFLNFEDEKLDALKGLFDKSGKRNVAEDDEFLDEIWYIKGVAKNQRINNQSGDFIFVGKNDNINEQLHKLPALTIVIDAPTKKTLLEQLESLNIHGGAVYPDLTHMSNYIREKYVNESKLNTLKEFDIDLSAFDDKKKGKSNSVNNRNNTPKTIKKLTTDFDSNTFWTVSKNKKLKKFADTNKLKLEPLKEIIEDIIAFERQPIRSDVASIMNPSPRFTNYKKLVNPMIDKINDFSLKLKVDNN